MLIKLLVKNFLFFFKLGRPFLFVYHMIIASVFFNTAAEDAHGLEKWGNTALIPFQYFFEGKKAIPEIDENLQITYHLERRFTYHDHFYVKTACAAVTLPLSVVIGGTLKSLSYLSKETRDRATRLWSARHCRKVNSNHAYYKSLGLEINDFKSADFIDPPKWKRHPAHENPMKAEVEALQEIVRILHTHEIPFWLDCGSCLGAYQYGGAIPSDWDIDIALLFPDFENARNALNELDPNKFVVQDWSGRAKPNTYLKVLVKETGVLIDIYNFAIYEDTQQVGTILSNEFNIFFPHEWLLREVRYTTPMPYSYVFPLKKALFEGIEVPVPGQIEKYLQVFYGENLAPARVYNEITGNYEKDLDHPYWQIPYVH